MVIETTEKFKVKTYSKSHFKDQRALLEHIRDSKEFKIKFMIYFRVNSQAPARKSNPQAPESPCAAISVKTRSWSSKISTKVFVGAENPKLTLKSEIVLRNSRKSLNFI